MLIATFAEKFNLEGKKIAPKEMIASGEEV